MDPKTDVIGGLLLIIVISSSYWVNPTLFKVPLLFYALIIIITGLFSMREYHNKKLYLIIVTPLLLLTWILDIIYVQYSSNKNIYLIYIMNGLLTIISIWLIIYSFKKWDKYDKALQNYDHILAKKPNDTVALNNKGVELVNQRKYEKGMKCFDKIIEIYPKDAAAWHNKIVLLEKQGKYQDLKKYQTKSLESESGLKLAAKSGKMILESKK